MIFNSLECLQNRPLDREAIFPHSIIISLIETHHQPWDGFDDPSIYRLTFRVQIGGRKRDSGMMMNQDRYIQ